MSITATTIQNFPNNSDEYIGAENVMKWLHGRSSGVFGANGQLAVTAGSGLSVDLSDGVFWMANNETDGTVCWVDTEKNAGTKLNLPLDIADAAMPRIDRVVATWETANYAKKPQIEILKGTPASEPTPPELTNTTLKRQISFAQVLVPASASTITVDNITDERLDPDVCGIVTASVGVDTSVMDAQFKALLELIEGLISDLTADTAAMLKAVYDPQGKSKDIFKSIDAAAAKYEATLTLDGWVTSTSEEQSAGYPYAQEATLTALTPGAPTVTAASRFLSPCSREPVGVPATDEVLDEAMATINGQGVTSSVDGGKIRTIIQEKPTADVTLQWLIRTEV